MCINKSQSTNNHEPTIRSGEFLMEYVGEVLDYEQFYKRAQAYSDENNMHHYFMSLKGMLIRVRT